MDASVGFLSDIGGSALDPRGGLAGDVFEGLGAWGVLVGGLGGVAGCSGGGGGGVLEVVHFGWR